LWRIWPVLWQIKVADKSSRKEDSAREPGNQLPKALAVEASAQTSVDYAVALSKVIISPLLKLAISKVASEFGEGATGHHV
jgi:hypothetical protein